MQNFTLGKKGYSMLLFALVLLIGSSPTFGQCPVPVDEDPGTLGNQQFYCALATVSQLKIAAFDGVAPQDVRWYDSANPSANEDAIPSDEILENNKIYFAGNNNKSCPTRTGVTAKVTDVGPPELSSGEDEFFTPCQRTAGNPDNNNIGTLKDGIMFEPVAGYSIQYFLDQYDRNSDALSDDTPLQAGKNYFAGYVEDPFDETADPQIISCQSSRTPIRYEPIVVPAPTAAPEQQVCFGTTVGELEASGTNRWYRTATSEPPIGNSTVLEDGKTYYATQIIPSDGPPCESKERTAVTVTVEPTAFNESTQRFCESIGEGNDFRKPEVRDLSPEGATWFADATSTEPLDPQTELIDDEDYFNRDNGSECSQDRVVVEFFPTPNAGSTTSVPVCSNDDAFNLVDEINDSQLGPPQQTGTFSPALSTGTNIFNPADYQPGSYNFRYIVEGNEDCPTDESRITVVVEAAPNAGEDTPLVFCQNEFQALVEQIFANPEQAEATFASLIGDDVDTDGDFSNDDLETIANNYMAAVQANSFPFNAQSTYTVTNENGCSDSSLITLTVNQSPNAGENGSVEVSREDAPFNLITELGSPQSGGTWTPGNPDGTFNPATGDSGIYTYTVTNEFECTDSATVTVTILEECPIVEETTQSFCESISDPNGNNPRRPRVNDLTPSGATWYATADSEEPLPGNTILTDGTTYYAGNSGGTCESRTPVLVNIDDSPNAGRTTNITVCGADEPFDLLDRYNPSILGAPDAGGTIIPALASGTTIFDPSVDAARQYTYRVESTNNTCPTDTSRITVNITNPIQANAGEDVEEDYCSNDGVIDLFTLVPNGVSTNGIFEGYENGQFDTSRNVGENEITYTVDDIEGCSVADSATYFIKVFEAPNAGPGADLNFCITDIQEMSQEEVLAIFENLIPDDVTEGGELSTSINQLIIQFNSNSIGEFSTTYTVSNENCTDSATYSVTISDTEEADAGSNVDDLVFCSTDADVNLNDFLSDDALQNGNFEELENGVFSPSAAGVGTYTFTFTVDNTSDCVTGSDSAIYTVEVLQGPDAGENGSVTLRNSDDPVNLFAYLSGTPEEGGLWNPGNSDGDLDPSQYQEGQFEFEYTVISENGCEASAIVTVTITDDEIICPIVTDAEQAFCESIEEGNNSRLPRVSDLMPLNTTWYATVDSNTPLASTTVLISGEDYFAGNEDGTCTTRDRVVVTLDDSPNAGRTTNITVCSDDAPFDLVGRINSSILGTPDAGGTFTPALASGTTIFDPSVDVARQYIYSVQSTNEVCPDDESRITVNILRNVDANAGEDFAREFCIKSDDVNLFDLLAEGVTMNGTFEGFVDGIFSPSTFGEGVIEITYNVGEDLPCVEGSASANITITVTDAPDAPTADANQSFCLVDGPTVGDIVVTGSNVVIYTDSDLTDEADITTSLVSGMSYYATSTSESETCSSDAVEITVTITDPAAPTLSLDGDEFCRSDNPTVQKLINNFTGEVVIYNASTGGASISPSTPLQNGATYYAASVNGTSGCESSERTAVVAKVEFCGIPEGFSPNGDGINDRFVIPDIAENYPNYTIEFYNRYGNVVYKGNASTPDWDGITNQSGTLGNDVLPVGVYFYILNYNDGQTSPIQGKLYLSR